MERKKVFLIKKSFCLFIIKNTFCHIWFLHLSNELLLNKMVIHSFIHLFNYLFIILTDLKVGSFVLIFIV